MKVKKILNDCVQEVTGNMHKTRRNSLQTMVESLVQGADLSVTSLGRNIDSATTEKHQIKRSMRLCSNVHLHSEVMAIYSALSRRLLAQQITPIILVDWSDLDARKEHFLLRASLVFEGRSLTLLEKIYPLSDKEKPTTHKHFMMKFQSMVPKYCRPIIVTDAGFRVPWFKLVESLGWDFIGRVRNATFCKSATDKDWHAVKDLYLLSSSKPMSLGAYQLARRNPIDCNMLVYKRKKQGRKHLTATGERSRRSKHSLANAAKEREPWLLATSLVTTSKLAKKVVKIYSARMQIEESFRDLKTGLNFNVCLTRNIRRLSVLLLIALLAQFVLFLVGVAVKMANLHKRYQANTVSNENVLSYQFLGLRAFKDKYLQLNQGNFKAALIQMRVIIGNVAHV